MPARLSKALSQSQVATYYTEFTASTEKIYYTEGGKLTGTWHGKLATEFGLVGAVDERHYNRLAAGCHPHTGEELIRHIIRPKSEPKTEANEPAWLTDDKAWMEHIKELFIAAEEAGKPSRWTGDLPHESAPPAEYFRKLAEIELADLAKASPPVEPATKEEPKIRRAWDLTISPPKGVSAAALVAGDERVLNACREALKITLDATEEYTQARLGGNKGVRTTGNWVAAVFEHDSARPTKGMAPAPQAHWHVVVFNMTDAGDKIRSLEPRELYRVQTYATAIYRAELAVRLRQLGYEIRRTTEPLFETPGCKRKMESFEIVGFSEEYLRSISRRRRVIVEEMERRGVTGPKAAAIVTEETRKAKQSWEPEALRAEHRKQAEEYGNEPDRVLVEAKARTLHVGPAEEVADKAIEFARTKLSERAEVFDRYETIRDALRYGLGTMTLRDAEQALDARRGAGDGAFIRAEHYRQYAPGERYATPEAVKRNEAILEWLKAGRDRLPAVAPDVSFERHSEFVDNPMRGVVLERILASRDRAIALQGSAGSKKTTGLMLLKPLIERSGYTVKALAPTGAAVQELQARGIEAETLEAFLHRTPKETPIRTYYFVDETSLASTRQMHEFIQRVQPHDRVLFVGDDSPKRKVGQHKSVEGGRIFYQMQQAGIQTAYLNRMYRQKTPELQEVAKLLRAGKTDHAVDKLVEQGYVREIEKPKERFAALAQDFVREPEGTFGCAADNESKQRLNKAIREAMRTSGRLEADMFTGDVFVPRGLTRAEAQHAWCYHAGDIIRFAKSVPKEFQCGDIVRVEAVDANRLYLRRADGTACWFDPAKAPAVQVFTTERRSFAVGERIQFTNGVKDKHVRVSNRDTGTITELDEAGNAAIRLDTQRNRTVRLNLRQMRHIDHAYCMTSYCLQGKTTKRLLLEAGTTNSARWPLLGKDFAYVGGTRPEFELILYTDSIETAKRALSQEHIKPQALPRERIEAYRREEAARKMAVGA